MYKWIAQYMESTGDMDAALHYYTMAKDHLSIVRVLCFLNNYHQASEIAQNSGDKAAAYHLARQFEAMDRIDEALSFFTKAQAYGNAIRICKVIILYKKKIYSHLKSPEFFFLNLNLILGTWVDRTYLEFSVTWYF